MNEYRVKVKSESALMRMAEALSAQVAPPAWIFLTGKLGAGKTTWVRGFLRGLGYESRVKSPTYTLIEPYETAAYRVLHLDLYRMTGSRQSFEGLGLADYDPDSAVVLVEWPETMRAFLPTPVLELHLEDGVGDEMRWVRVRSESPEWSSIRALLDSQGWDH